MQQIPVCSYMVALQRDIKFLLLRVFVCIFNHVELFHPVGAVLLEKPFSFHLNWSSNNTNTVQTNCSEEGLIVYYQLKRSPCMWNTLQYSDYAELIHL